MYKFVFVHLPKTGGTTLHAALRRAVGKDAVSPNFIASKLSDQDAVELDKYTVISGHISIIDVRRYFPDRKILTILREPLDRCVSWYYFARAMRPAIGAATDVFVAQTYGIEEFFNQDLHLIYRNIFNRQVRQLGNHVLNFDLSYAEALENAKQTLRSAAWVGRQETLDTDIADLATIVPNAESAYLQIENRTEGRKGMNELSSNVINRISSLNEYDVALYKFACEEIF